MSLQITSQTCTVEPFLYQATPQTGGEDGASSNQINEQALEDYLSRLRNAVCADIQAIIDQSGSATVVRFTDLSDVPNSYVGSAGELVRVNATATGLEFFSFTPVVDFIDLGDVPNSYAGQGGLVVAVRGSEDGLEFIPPPTPEALLSSITARLVQLIKPLSGTTLAASSLDITGNNSCTVGGNSLSHPVVSNANTLAGVYHVRVVSNAGAGSTASIRQTVGAVLGFGGWRMSARWGSSTNLAQQRFFVGVINQTGAIANVNPTTLTNLVGFSYDSAETTLRFIHNDAAGTATTVNLGAGFPVDSTSFYEMTIEMAPGSGVVNYRIVNVGTGAVSSGSTNTDLPADSVLLNQYLWLNNGTTASACQVDMQSMYLELYQ